MWISDRLIEALKIKCWAKADMMVVSLSSASDVYKGRGYRRGARRAVSPETMSNRLARWRAGRQVCGRQLGASTYRIAPMSRQSVRGLKIRKAKEYDSRQAIRSSAMQDRRKFSISYLARWQARKRQKKNRKKKKEKEKKYGKEG